MAGRGSRFQDVGYTLPKPLIDVDGQKMIEAVVKNLKPEYDHKFIFVCLKEHFTKYSLNDLFKSITDDKFQVVLLDGVTEGAACTCLLAREYINNDDPLIVVNSDQIILDLDLHHILTFSEVNECDGVVGAFLSNSKKNSYVKLGEDLSVADVKEKIVISNFATNGLHFWSKGTYFVESAEEMIKNNDRYNNEFYVAPTYNYLIKNGKKILPFFFNLHFPIGTPEDLRTYLEYKQKILWDKNKKKYYECL